ncbi:hypothetical protein [Nocardioides sp.]|uniref:NADase-type glycan-binding domain-containing protein n=1 Tax=Nocardioides sp. TaxID=35761 RepID=UPI003511962C
MARCVRCDHELGIGRFCINCGHAVGRPVTETPGARYPLYVEDVATPSPAEPADSVFLGTVLEAGPPPPVPSGGTPRRRRGALPWVVALLAVALIGTLGGLLLSSGEDDDPPASASEAPSASGDPSPSQRPGKGGRPGKDDDVPGGGRLAEVAPTAEVGVPAEAPPSTGVDGERVTYVAAHLVDRDRETAWRMPGNATGDTLIFTLARPTKIRFVGLINGYTKREAGYDGYAANRRVLQVEWGFDDGSTVTQVLTDGERGIQSRKVRVPVTSTVTLRLVAVSAPGAGADARDFTALSEVVLLGKEF